MALNETSKEYLSLKKLQGKAHTSNDKDLANEGLPSGVTISAATGNPTIKWVGGSAPTLGAETAIELFRVGTQIYGATVGDLS